MMGITLTGADERTAIADMVALADLGAEIGLLYTHDPEGRHRYPHANWIIYAAELLNGRAAIHVCGKRARDQLMKGELRRMVCHVSRVQVNGRMTAETLQGVCDILCDHTVITQHNEANESLLHHHWSYDATNHAILVDASGGRGQTPGEWKCPSVVKPVGFAGGLGPHNLREELPKIVAVANGDRSWIDMENGLRDACDWFDIERAMEVMRIWNGFWEAKN